MIWLLLACADKGVEDTATPVDLVASLADPGPYRVGFHVEEVSYPDTVSGADRALRLTMWYPTEDSAGVDAEYLIPQEDPGAWQDATPADGPFPLVLFSHGHQGFAENSSFLMEHLASHGYAVVAPDHTDNTTFDGSERDTAIYSQRPGDLSAVLDHLETVSGDHPLAGRLDVGPVLAMGHSFGGYTVFALGGATYDVNGIEAACADGTGGDVCSSWDATDAALLGGGFFDDRLGAILAMAPGDFDLFGAGVAGLAVPAMLMTGTLDGSTASDGVNYASGIPDGSWLNVTGAGHQSFTDFWFLETDPDLIDADEGFRIIDVYALAWARWLGGDDSVLPVLDGSEIVAEAAALDP